MLHQQRLVDAAGAIGSRGVMFGIGALAAAHADDEIAQALALRAEADVERGMAADAAEGERGEVVTGEDVRDALTQFAGTPGPRMRAGFAASLPLPSSKVSRLP